MAVGGGTADGAAAAAARLIAAGCRGLVSFGLAGGLDPALAAGALVVPRAVLADGRSYAADAALIAALGGATAEALLASATVLATTAEKGAAWRAGGAAAVDMESGAVARAAAAAGLPFAVLRAVCDPATRPLPPAALVALDTGGAVGPARVALSVLRRPGQVAGLLALARDAARARRALVDAVAAVDAAG